jgi:hypothetical protein
LWSQASLRKKARPYIKKQPKTKRGGNMAHVREHLPSKCEALGPNFSIGKKKKEKNR